MTAMRFFTSAPKKNLLEKFPFLSAVVLGTSSTVMWTMGLTGLINPKGLPNIVFNTPISTALLIMGVVLTYIAFAIMRFFPENPEPYHRVLENFSRHVARYENNEEEETDHRYYSEEYYAMYQSDLKTVRANLYGTTLLSSIMLTGLGIAIAAWVAHSVPVEVLVFSIIPASVTFFIFLAKMGDSCQNFIDERNVDKIFHSVPGIKLLHFTARRGSVEAIKILLEAKADVFAKDSEGRTALTIAAEKEDPAVFETIKLHIARREMIAFCGGLHDRVGRNSVLAPAFARNSLFDREVLRIPFSLVANRLPSVPQENANLEEDAKVPESPHP